MRRLLFWRGKDGGKTGVVDRTDDPARLRCAVRPLSGSDRRRAAALRAGGLAGGAAGDEKRIHLYDHHVGLVVEQLKCITGQKYFDADFPSRVKAVYIDLLPDYPRFEIAESFFNSVYCRLFKHRDLTPDKLFVFSSQPERRFRDIPRPLARDFTPMAICRRCCAAC